MLDAFLDASLYVTIPALLFTGAASGWLLAAAVEWYQARKQGEV